MHAFSAEGVLERYREAVLDPSQGAQLEAAALLSPQRPEFCLARYQRLAPLQQWLVDLLPT